MAILLTSPISLLLKKPTTVPLRYLCPKYASLSFSPSPQNPYPTPPRLLFSTTTRRFATPYPSELPDPTSDKDDEEPDKPPTSYPTELSDPTSDKEAEEPDKPPTTFTDEWGEKSSAQEPDPPTKFPDSDPPKDDDEWGQPEGKGLNGLSNDNGVAGANEMDDSIGDDYGDRDDRVEELKRCLVDSVYGTDLGFKASSEVRAEIFELVSQLEALNPISGPTDAVDLLDGNWVLLYTAFSELLPLLAVGTIPLLKVEKICQSINTTNFTIDNSITLSSPLATSTFSASATFEVRSPSRIQVQFREGTFQPPVIKSRVDLPENVDLFGQKISLSPVQQYLNPLQEAFAGVARAVSGQPPLKVPIPGERSKSWLLITYLDKDFRISRGDGGLFVLVKQGSPLLDQ